ncbi:MAG: chorismate mutase [Pyrinomonadaceae bacterium]|nr:chorismate mutase [Pyrinomonadaceae bacterium]
MKLKDWREEIDLIDSQIVKLIGQRSRVVSKIGTLKAKAGIDIHDPKREEEILRNAVSNADGNLCEATILSIYRRILVESRQIQIDASKIARNEEAGIY